MGLFDSIAGNLLGNVLGGQSNGALGSIINQILSGQHGDLGTLLGGIINQAGGIGGLQQRAQDTGLTDLFASWVGTGQNQAINTDQLQQLLGSDAIQGVASKFGVNIAEITPMIASMLPQIIDKLTPQGQIDPALHQPDVLSSALSQLMQGSGLMSIVGSLFGNRNA
jgi:uncharacterized protein YidB (DUF937 family)